MLTANTPALPDFENSAKRDSKVWLRMQCLADFQRFAERNEFNITSGLLFFVIVERRAPPPVCDRVGTGASPVQAERSSAVAAKLASPHRKNPTLQALSELLSPSHAIRSIRNRPKNALRILIISPPIQHPAVLSLSHPAPLLKEERHSLLSALPTNRHHPLPLHRTRPRPTLAPNNHPGNPRQIDFPKVFQQRLNRQQANLSRSLPKMIHPRQPMFPILNADAPPYIFLQRRKP